MSIDIVPAYLIHFHYVTDRINKPEVASLLAIYIFLAFGCQFIFGYLADIINNPKKVIAMGFGLCLLAILCSGWSIMAAVILVGAANSLVHVGGGIVSLKTDFGKATYPGMFVAFGAWGLYLGTWLGKNQHDVLVYLVAIVSLFLIAVLLMKLPEQKPKNTKAIPAKLFSLVLTFVFLVILTRSLAGAFMKFTWPGGELVPLLAVCSVFLGKFCGGLIADRFGWIKSTTIFLVISLPLYFLGLHIWLFGLLTLFLFQITMPVTLTMFGRLFPKNPGFAFGLTCLALYLGYLLVKINPTTVFATGLVAAGIVISVILSYLAIRWAFNLKCKHDYYPE